MLYSIRHSSRHDIKIPLLLVYLGKDHPLDNSNHPNGSRFFMLYYCTEGSGDFTIDGNRVILHPGQLIFTMPDTPYSCKALPDGCTVHLIGLHGPVCKELLETCGLKEAGIYQLAAQERLDKNIDQLILMHQNNSNQAEYSKTCYSLLIDLAPDIQKLPGDKPQVMNSDAVMIVIDYLEAHFMEPVSLDVLASEVHLNKDYLCTMFKKETGNTILHHLTLIRIGWARLYLEQYPNKKAYEIGKMCGFDSPSYFGKKFREITGHTPDSYRRVNAIKV